MSTPTSAWDSCLADIGGEKVATIKCLEVLFANTVSLIVGIVTGTYSSIFIASPLLLVWEKMKRR